MDDNRTLKDLAKEVLDAQTGVNLTGLAGGFARACLRLRHLVRAGEGGVKTMGEADCRYHPIVVAWMSKLLSLTGDPHESKYDEFIDEDDCKRLIAGGFIDLADEALNKCRQMAEQNEEE